MICELADRWQIDHQLAARLFVMADYLPFEVRIISGFRTAAEQAQLEIEGRPTAPDNLSTHRSCPATGADLRVSVAVTEAVKATFGEAAVRAGLRWGGGSRVNENGIPSDWNHVDLGPRRQA